MSITNIGLVNFSIIISAIILGIVAIFAARKLVKISFPYFFLGLGGFLIGLLIGYLVSIPLRTLPGVYGRWVPILLNIVVTASTFYLFVAQSQRLVKFVKTHVAKRIGWDLVANQDSILLDTSVLIDGRIEKLAETGFIIGDLIVPRFVLYELQKIADSKDGVKRAKGRRGMETLTNLQKKKHLHIDILDLDESGIGPVDSRLVKLAKQKKFWLMTLDYNLLQVAKIQKVRVLNINELILALKPSLLPGEELVIEVMQKGKEATQGVGYLPDGTMVVIERGVDLIGQVVTTRVNRVFQAASGQVIFVEPNHTDNK